MKLIDVTKAFANDEQYLAYLEKIRMGDDAGKQGCEYKGATADVADKVVRKLLRGNRPVGSSLTSHWNPD